MVAGLSDVQHGKRCRSLPGREEKGCGATLKRGNTLFNDILGRVLDARVDVAELGEGEEVLRVLGTVEDVRGRLVDRGGPRVRDRIGLGALYYAGSVGCPWPGS